MRRVIIAAVIILLTLLLLYPLSHAQEHRHGDRVISSEAGKFYQGWMKPDNRMESCCNRMDCEETEARFQNGRWSAFSRLQNRWIDIPATKVEREREVPPGAHLCESPAGVLCFGAGGGT
jgi:hypothetical protein